MGRKELVVKFSVYWIVGTGLFFGLASLIASAPGAQPVLKPEILLGFIGIVVALIIYWSDKWRDWLEE